VSRFHDYLASRPDEPLYLSEICAAIGVSERTLRDCCQDHLGMGPHRYLWLRRMHLTRRALREAHSARTTVTDIATAHGFWELGRFAVEYRTLFDELPSATLGRSIG
jgi:AraC-like DNA-binding protein